MPRGWRLGTSSARDGQAASDACTLGERPLMPALPAPASWRRDVTFSYPARPGVPVLQGLTLTLPRGKVTAVVGRCERGRGGPAAAWGPAGTGGGVGSGAVQRG